MPLLLVPIFAFFTWASLLFYYIPVLRYELGLGDHVLAALLFASYLVQIIVWSAAGPGTAAVLTGAASLIVLYLCLALKEWALFLQALMYGVLYLAVASFLHGIQKRLKDGFILREKIQEDLIISQHERTRKAELEKAMERRIDRFLELHQFAETLKGMPTVPELARRVVEEAHGLVGQAEECILYLVDEKNEELSPVATTLPRNDPAEMRGNVFDQWVMHRSRPLMIEDSQTDFRFSAEKKSGTDLMRAVCASPLMTENRVLGVLRASSSKPDAFSSDDLHALDIISGLAAVTLRNRLLQDKMEELAVRDGLTGLYLNRYFQERLTEELIRSHSKNAKFSLILLDVDHFKKYNDEFGHTAGDLVLKNAASILQHCLEPTAIAARYGGEEFVVLLPNKGIKDAMKAAEKIRSELEGRKFSVRRVEGVVTASLGVAAYPQDGKTRETLFSVADDNLYLAKKCGRNRVCGNI
jgi:diguanylate cyclase (GGDEF)-like protein